MAHLKDKAKKSDSVDDDKNSDMLSSPSDSPPSQKSAAVIEKQSFSNSPNESKVKAAEGSAPFHQLKKSDNESNSQNLQRHNSNSYSDQMEEKKGEKYAYDQHNQSIKESIAPS